MGQLPHAMHALLQGHAAQPGVTTSHLLLCVLQASAMLERGARFAKFVIAHCPSVWVNMRGCNLMTGETYVPDNLYAHVAASLPLHKLPPALYARLRAGLSEYHASVNKALRRRQELQQQLAQVLPRTTDISLLSRRLEAAPGIRAAVEPVLGSFQQQQQQRQASQAATHESPGTRSSVTGGRLIALLSSSTSPTDVICEVEQLLDEMEGTVQTELQGAILIYRQIWDGPLRPLFAQLPAACLPYSMDLGQITQEVCRLILNQPGAADTGSSRMSSN